MKKFILVFLVLMFTVSAFAFEVNPTHKIWESDIYNDWLESTGQCFHSYGKFMGKVCYFLSHNAINVNEGIGYKVWIDWNPNTEQWEEEEVTDIHLLFYYKDTGRHTTLYDEANLGEPLSTNHISKNVKESEFYNKGRAYIVRYEKDIVVNNSETGKKMVFVTREELKGRF